MQKGEWLIIFSLFFVIFSLSQPTDANHKITGRSFHDNNTNETHLECVNLACVSVNGSGTDLCKDNNDCQNQTNMTHMACVNLACISVTGSGEDLCKSSRDCLNTTVNETDYVRAVRANRTVEINLTHLECVNLACAQVTGAGVDQCADSNDCLNQTNMTHFKCIDQACVLVNFTGISECRINDDCVNTSNLTGGGGVVPPVLPIAEAEPVQAAQPTNIIQYIFRFFQLLF